MFDLPGEPVLDKDRLVGGCLRLPLRVDAARLAAEIDALGEAVWGDGGRVGVHRPAQSLFLRGHAPAAGDLPVHDQPVLERLPYAREVMAALGAPAQRCLLARLPGGRTIAPHIDRAPYFSKTIRIHVPVVTHAKSYMLAAGLVYVMAAGEVWALNNCAVHAVWNADPAQARTHLICDFTLTPALEALLASGERGLGQRRPAVEQHLASLPRGVAAGAG
jgi:hypothetical protein